MDIKKLELFAAKIRLETTKMIGVRGFGHISGSLSVADVLAVLYGGQMDIWAEEPSWPKRDRLVLSKGHAGPALYAALALRGFFPMEWLNTLNQPGTRLPSHCDMTLTPGVDMTTGSLGQGASTAVGMALGAKMDGLHSKIYLILGDGECNEGQVWEAAMMAAQYKLSNLVAFVDANGKQLDGTTPTVMGMDIRLKFEAFGWNAVSIDGNDIASIVNAMELISADRPTCIILNTVKGAKVQAISSIEYNHHIPLEGDRLAAALAECEEMVAKLEGEL